MADRVPLPRVSTAYAAATAGPDDAVGVGVGIDSTASTAAASATTTSANPLEAPVARAALLTMASELTVLDTLGFLSGPVGGGRDFTKAYRAALESLASPDPPPNAGTALVSALRSCASDALVALFGSSSGTQRAEADAVSVLLDAANARVSRAVLLGQSSGSGGASAASPGAATAFAAVEMTDAGFWKGGGSGGQQKAVPADLLALAAARGPANLKARPGADRAAARQEATLGVAAEDDAGAAAPAATGEAAAARGGKGGAKRGGAAAKKGGKVGAAAGAAAGGAAAAAAAAARKALSLPSPSDLPPVLALELAIMLERVMAPAEVPEEEPEPEPEEAPEVAAAEAGAAPPTGDAAAAASTEANPADGGGGGGEQQQQQQQQPAAVAAPSSAAAPSPPAPKGYHRIREACRKRVAALRATRAGEVARALDADVSGVAAALRAGRYDDVEVLCAEVASVVRGAAEASAEALATSAVEAASAAAAAAAASTAGGGGAPEDDGPGRGRGRGGAGAVGGTTMRKGKLLGLADQFCMALTSALAEVALDYGSADRKKAKKGGGLRRTTRAGAAAGGGDGGDAAAAAAGDPNAPPQLDEHGNPVVSSPASRPRTGPMPEAIQANREPYLHGAWRRRPYAPRPYERLKAYKVNAMSKPLVEWKLTTEKRGRCDGSACAVAPGSLGTYSLEMEAFDTGCACLKNNLECGPNCGCADAARARGQFSDADPTSTEFPAACANRAVTRRETLVLNKDVKEVNAWGMDCYSRRNIVDAVLESQAFGSYVKPDYRALARAEEAQAAALARGEKIHREDKVNAAGDGENKKEDEAEDPTSPASRPGSAALTAHCCSAATRERVNDWVERVLHPAINGQGAQGWDLARALRQLVEKGGGGSEVAAAAAAKAAAGGKPTAATAASSPPPPQSADEAEAALTAASVDATSAASAAAAAAVAARLEDVGSDYFRVHPKGVGMQVIRPGGLPRLTFVEEYLGEVHSPWRWFEVQDALKKVTKDELPDFYNIVLERPRDDPWGYDALFVDAASRGAFASRMSHSCTPNCQAVVMACGGRLTIAVYTLRHVHEGEELTFDYASVTESEKEFRDAICLCGTSGCRGSFLTFSGSRAFQAVMNERHNVLHRQAIILHSGDSSELTEADKAVLERFGVRDSCLGRRGLSPEEEAREGGVMARRVPPWLEKWAALILHYVERERELLPKALLALPPALGGGYSRSSAALEARGVADSRLQNVVITVDKVKYVLSQSKAPEAQACAPLRRLSDAEAAAHVWNGDRSIARRLLRAAAPALSSPQVARGVASAATAADLRRALERAGVGPGPGHHARLHELAEAVLREPEAASFEEARQRLLALVPMLRRFDAEARGGHTAAADVATLYGRTRVWFCAERRFASFTSPAVRLAPSDLCVIGDGGGGGTAGGGAVGAPAKKKQKVGAKGKKAAAAAASKSKSASPAAAATAEAEAEAAAGEQPATAAAATADAPASGAEEKPAAGDAAPPAAATSEPAPAATTTTAEGAAAATTTTAAEAAPPASDATAATTGAAAEAPPPPAPPAPPAPPSGPESDLLPLPEGALCDPVPPHLPPAADDEAGLVDEATAARAGLAKKYGPWFIWGQLSGWFKQTVYDPTASLSAERRGTISLPDVESCYGGCARSRYQARDRAAMLEHVATRPDAMWKVGTLWSFKNEGKVYGSPAFDSRWSELTGEFEDPMPELLAELRGAWVPYGTKGAAGASAAAKAAASAPAPAPAPAAAPDAPAPAAAAAASAMEVDKGDGGDGGGGDGGGTAGGA